MGALGYADFSWLGILFGNLAQVIPGWPLFAVCLVVFLAPIVYNFVAPKPKSAEAAE